MRMAFGLVSLLVAVGIIAMLMNQQSSSIRTAAKTQQKVQDTFGSLTSGGLAEAKESISLSPAPAGGKFRSLLVESVSAGGPMGQYFGLQKGDQIVGVGGNPFEVIAAGDPELATAQVFEARARSQKLMVRRGDQTIDLPQERSARPANGVNGITPVPTH